jgi:hypothetical protein
MILVLFTLKLYKLFRDCLCTVQCDKSVEQGTVLFITFCVP